MQSDAASTFVMSGSLSKYLRPERFDVTPDLQNSETK